MYRSWHRRGKPQGTLVAQHLFISQHCPSVKLQMKRNRRWLQAGAWLHALLPTQGNHINHPAAACGAQLERRHCVAPSVEWLTTASQTRACIKHTKSVVFFVVCFSLSLLFPTLLSSTVPEIKTYTVFYVLSSFHLLNLWPWEQFSSFVCDEMIRRSVYWRMAKMRMDAGCLCLSKTLV